MSGIFDQDANPPPTFEAAIAERRRALAAPGSSRAHVLGAFVVS